jgi:hypothetical protein
MLLYIKPSSVRGLHGNPARTGRIFSEDASYFKNLDADASKEMKTMVVRYTREQAREWAKSNVKDTPLKLKVETE